MPNKIIFKVYNSEQITGDMLRINDNIRNYLNQIKAETGLSATKIVEKCLEFAVDNYEVQKI